MPTYETTARFEKDLKKLTRDERTAFRLAVQKFIEDLKAGRKFGRGLRVKGVEGAPGVFEMTWAGDGRATFEFGGSKNPPDAHVIWRRVGSHVVFHEP